MPEKRLRVPEVMRAHRFAIAAEVLAVAAVEDVERERPDRVDVALPVRKEIALETEDRRIRLQLEIAVEECELVRVVAFRLLERDTDVVARRETHAELVGLQRPVALAKPLERPAAGVEVRLRDVREQRAVVRERGDHALEVVLRRAVRGLASGP